MMRVKRVKRTNKTQRKLYLAYGSNLSADQMDYRCPDARIVGQAVIEDYELLFKGSQSGCYATIEQKKGSKVPVLVWSISEDDEASLDVYEGVAGGFYYKKDLEVDIQPIGAYTGLTGTHKAMVYIMDERRMFGIPSVRYYNTLHDGYKEFDFDLNILEHGLFESCRRKYDIKSSVEIGNLK